MNPLLDESKKPELHNVKYYLRFARNWTIGLGVFTAFCLGYYHMCIDVWRDQDLEKIAVKAEEIRILKRDQEFTRAQVDRIVAAISNRPPIVILIQEPRHHRKHHEPHH